VDAQYLHFINTEKAEAEIMGLDDSAVEYLYQFGSMMVGDAGQWTSHLDSKLTAIFGWSSGVLAFLVVGTKAQGSLMHVSAMILAVALTLAAVILAALGLKTDEWPSPSEEDWFREGILEHPGHLRRYHVISMLETHQYHLRKNGRKAKLLRYAEKALVAGAIVVAAILLWRAF
jgi:hypothetical protein